MQQEQDELNRVQDFDLDAYLDEVEPTHRVQTVNTRGDLLVKYAKLGERRDAAISQLERLSESLSDAESDKAETLADAGDDQARIEFDAIKSTIEKLDGELRAVGDEYARNKARFTMKAPDKSARARIVSEEKLKDHKQSTPTADYSTLRLMLAAVVEIVVIRDGHEHAQKVESWTLARFEKFLEKIGVGQARLLVDAYLGLASGEITPPFSQES